MTSFYGTPDVAKLSWESLGQKGVPANGLTVFWFFSLRAHGLGFRDGLTILTLGGGGGGFGLDELFPEGFSVGALMLRMSFL